MLSEFLIKGPPRSGKTTVALGAIERLHSSGVPVVYVVQSKDWVRDRARVPNFLKVPCMAWVDAISNPDPKWRAVVVESDCLALKNSQSGLDTLRTILSRHHGPTQIFIIETEYKISMEFDSNA